MISRNTAFTYRNKPVDTRQIGRELGGAPRLLASPAPRFLRLSAPKPLTAAASGPSGPDKLHSRGSGTWLSQAETSRRRRATSDTCVAFARLLAAVSNRTHGRGTMLHRRAVLSGAL